MSLRLIKPGASVALRHPKTGALIEPLFIRKNGTAVWPVLGASPDDPDDPKYTGEGDDEDDDEEDDEEEEEKPRRKAKARTSDDDSGDDDDDDEDNERSKASRQAKRYRLKLRETERERDTLNARIKELEDRDKPDDEVASRDLTEARSQIESLTEVNRVMAAQLAFFKSNQIDWIDPSDAFALAEREGLFDDVLDDDGTVDARELRRGLRDLAKRKPHLVKKIEDDPKGRARKSKDDEDEDDDEDEPSSRRSAAPMNGSRKGKRQAGPSRDVLAKKFPVLNRF